MNKAMIVPLLFLVFLMTGPMILAEEVDPPPVPPFFKEMNDNCAWTVTLTPASGTSKPAVGTRSIISYETTKSGNIHQIFYKWSDGSISKNWITGSLKISTNPGEDKLFIVPAYISSVPQLNDFPNLKWLNSKVYIKVTSWNGKKAYQFESKIQTNAGADSITDYTAYIDFLTQRPVSWIQGDYRYDVTSIVPVNGLDLPPEVAAKIKEYLYNPNDPNVIYRKK